MGYKQILYSENFRLAGDRYCDSQVDCGTQMANATYDVWSSMMGCYVAGVTKGLGGVMKAYIAGVQCFCDALETVSEELCGKKYYIVQPQDPGDKEITDAKADFCKTFKETFNPFFEKLETETDKVGQKHGKSAQAQVIGAYQKMWEVEASNYAKGLIESIPKFVDEQEKGILAEKKAKADQTKAIQILSQRIETLEEYIAQRVKPLEKENEDLRKKLQELLDNPPSKM